MRKKIVLISALLGAGIVILLIAIGGEKHTASSHTETRDAHTTSSPNEPLLAELTATTESSAALADDKNITRGLSKKIATELLAKNPGGPSLLDGKPSLTAENPEALINQILSKEIENFNYDDFNPTVRITELKIAVNSPDATKKFAEEFHAAFQPFLDSSIPTDNLSPAVFTPLITLTQKTAADLYTIPVPATLAPKLAKTIELLKTHEMIFRSIADAEIDPFRAFLALQLWEPKKTEFEIFYKKEIAPLMQDNGIPHS